jgi:hypothetical protein
MARDVLMWLESGGIIRLGAELGQQSFIGSSGERTLSASPGLRAMSFRQPVTRSATPCQIAHGGSTRGG